MSMEAAVSVDYRAIRARLRNPPNARPDTGIDLKRKPMAAPPVAAEPPAAEPAFEPRLNPPYKWRRELWAYNEELRGLFLQHSNRVTGRRIREVVAEHFGVTVEALDGRSRYYARLRQIAIYLYMHHVGASTTKAGQLFGRDHTTALHSYRTVERLIQSDPTFALHVRHIIQRCGLASEVRE